MASRLCEGCGQSSVEAALLLPAVMVLLALLLEPACLLYSRSVMEGAAAECARALATSTGAGGSSRENCEAFVRRRLSSIPNLSIFHSGGVDDWTIEVQGGEGSPTAVVEIEGHAKPLPLFGVVMTALGESDGQGTIMRVRVEERVRPSWLEGGYADWVSIWGA